MKSFSFATSFASKRLRKQLMKRAPRRRLKNKVCADRMYRTNFRLNFYRQSTRHPARNRRLILRSTHTFLAVRFCKPRPIAVRRATNTVRRGREFPALQNNTRRVYACPFQRRRVQKARQCAGCDSPRRLKTESRRYFGKQPCV